MTLLQPSFFLRCLLKGMHPRAASATSYVPICSSGAHKSCPPPRIQISPISVGHEAMQNTVKKWMHVTQIQFWNSCTLCPGIVRIATSVFCLGPKIFLVIRSMKGILVCVLLLGPKESAQIYNRLSICFDIKCISLELVLRAVQTFNG